MTGPSSVSVVIPVFNGERFIGEAIKSVLGQSVGDLECIVVDDGSTDGTRELLSQIPGIRVIEQANRGVSAARNIGAEASRGDLIAFLDADDVWLRSKLARQVPLFEDEDVQMAYCGLRLVDERLDPIRDVPGLPPEAAFENTILMRSGTMSVAATGVFTREAFEKLGGFDERMSTSADADLGCRAYLSGSIAYIEDCLYLYRTHNAQMHSNLEATGRDMSLLLSKLSAGGLIDAALERRGRGALALTLAIAKWRRGRRSEALRDLSRALWYRPTGLIDLTVTRLRRR